MKFIPLILIKIIFCAYYSEKVTVNKNPQSQNETNLNTTDDNPKFTVVNLSNRNDVQYIGQIYVGTLYKTMSVIFDTGSNVLWLPSINCKTCRHESLKYNPRDSKSSKNLNKEQNISFAIGFVRGYLYEDTVSLNSNKNIFKYNKELSVDSFRILTIIEEANLTGTISDGVMGLGINNEGNSKNSFIQSLYEQNKITSPTFSFYLLSINNISRLYIGDILYNEYIYALFKNNIQNCYVPGSQYYWSCNVGNGVSTYDKNKQNKKTFYSNSSFIFDSGSSYTFIPENELKIIIKNLNMSEKCIFNKELQLVCKCKNEKEFGFIEIEFDENNKYVLNLEKMINYKVGNNYPCQFQIQVNNYEEGIWILGDSSLRGSIISFDINDRKISFIQNISGVIDDSKMANSKTITQSWLFSTQFWIILAIIILVVAFLIFRF